MKIHKTEPKKARIEIIPMIDAIFFLLVFFMFSSLSMIRMKGAEISLPTSKGAGTGGAAPQNLVVSVSAGGDFYLGKNKVAREGLENALQSRLNANPNAAVVLNLSKNQTTQTLIDVLDVAGRVKKPSGEPLPVLIASEALDANGQPLAPASAAAKR